MYVYHYAQPQLKESVKQKFFFRFREKCQKVGKKQFQEQWREGRVEFIPIEWRTWLQLDKGELLLSSNHILLIVVT